MKIFNDNAFISADAAKDYQVAMARTNPKHLGPLNNPFASSRDNFIGIEKKLAPGMVSGNASFEQAVLQSLDSVSSAQIYSSNLTKEAIINPDSVDAHDITTAQSIAGMSLGLTRNILSRLVQGWKDLINTR